MDIENHPSYKQVILDVDRCAGTWIKIRKVHLHIYSNDTEDEDNICEEQECTLGDDLNQQTSNSDQSKRKQESNDDDDEWKEEDICDLNQTDDDNHHHANKYKQQQVNQQTDVQLPRKVKQDLVKLIIKILIAKPELCYYQGFHDVCLTYLAICGDEQNAFGKLIKVVDTHFATFMQPSLTQTQEYLDMVLVAVGFEDRKVEKFLQQAEVGAIFSLSWIITWFSHVIPYQSDVELLFSFFEKNDPHMIIYFCAQIVLYNKNELLEQECEMSTVHQFLQKLPKRSKLPLDDLMSRSRMAFRRNSPLKLKLELVSRKSISSYWWELDAINIFRRTIVSVPSLAAMMILGWAFYLYKKQI